MAEDIINYLTIKILDKNSSSPYIYIMRNFNDNTNKIYKFQYRLIKIKYDENGNEIISSTRLNGGANEEDEVGAWIPLQWNEGVLMQDSNGNNVTIYTTDWVEKDNISKLKDYYIQIKGTRDDLQYQYFNSMSNYYKFDFGAKVKIFGELISLCNRKDGGNAALVTDYKFAYLFQNSYVKDASELLLPSLTIGPNYFYGMFMGCSYLTTAPNLFATPLKQSCYANMFNSCTSLVTAPTLYAEFLAPYCYQNMFAGCKKLSNPPQLPALNLKNDCYKGMFSDCTSLKSTPSLPATIMAQECYNEMFQGCTNLIVAQQFPAITKLAPKCCQSMFEGCRNLTKIPTVLSATNMEYTENPEINDGFAWYCFKNMFDGCKKITTAPQLPISTALANGCYQSMFNGCDSLTTTPQLPATTLSEGCYERMFMNCINLVNISKLSSTTMNWSCYKHMFKGCTSLKTAPELPATILTDSAKNCYQGMFEGCTSLKNIPDLPATTLAPSCYYGMFKGCTSLVISPTLHTNPNKQDCYSQMFYNCVNLNTLNIEFTDFCNNSNTIDWVYNVSQTGTANINNDLLIYNYNDSCIPVKWKINKYSDDYLTFETLGRQSKISLVTKGSPKTIKLEYRVNNSNWLSLKDKVISIKEGDKLQLRGANKYFSSNFATDYYQFRTLGNNVKVSGNLMRLVNDQYNKKTDTWEIGTENQFNRLFEHTNVENIDQLKLPATKLHRECYARMFAGCKELFTIPKDLLSAANDKLEKGCYKEMFDGCTNLIGCSNTNENNLIDLPAKKLANNCYQAMFRGCENLDVLPVLTAKALEKDCYREMFYNCYKINSIEVKFDNWSNKHATDLWLSNTKNCTIFIKNNVLAEEYDQNHIPENSHIVKKED